jgi:hypothetical protein
MGPSPATLPPVLCNLTDRLEGLRLLLLLHSSYGPPAMKPLGYLQRHMLEFCQRHPGRHTISPDHTTVRVARSLQRRGLLHVTDCGMSTATGQPVLMVSANSEADRREAEQ